MPRVRSLPVVAALATALALSVAGPVSGAPAPERAAPEAARLLAEVERRVADVAEQLTEGARAYEQGQAALGAAQSAAVAADRAVEQAEAAAGDAGDAVREAVAVRYRNPAPAGLQVLVELRAGRLSEAVAVRTALARAQERAEQDEAAAVATAAGSVRARTDAQAAREQVVDLGREQADRLRALQDEAAGAEADLLAQVERLRLAQEADARAVARERARAAAADEAARAAAAADAARADAARRAAAQVAASDPDTTAAPAAPADTDAGTATGAGTGCAWTGPLQAPNGLLPDAVLCALETAPGHHLVPAAARAYDAMSRSYAADTGRPLCLTDSYRSYPAQVDVFRRKPGLAAVPGTSNHGWGRAVDLCGGAETFTGAAHRWLQEHGPDFGWTHPSWAEPGGSRPEPWHWEHAGQEPAAAP